MRPREDELIDPEILEQLDAIDATLAGEPVEPRFAELAELALLLAAERPEGPSVEFGASLDARVAERFGRGRAGGHADAGGGVDGPAAPGAGRLARRWSSWALLPALGLGATAVVAVVVALSVLGSGGGGQVVSHGLRELSPALRDAAGVTVASGAAPAGVHAAAPSTVNGAAGAAGAGTHGRAFTETFFGAQAGKSAAQAPARTATSLPASPGPTAPKASLGPIQTVNGNRTPATTPNVTAPAPAPLPNGRRSIQSSILDLGTPARRMDAVAQEVFNVVRSVNAIVQSSNVSSTGGLGASAEFQLRVPSQNLSEALNGFSHLRYASVVSRTDNTTDVNNSYLSLQRRIAAAEDLLTRLRAKLAGATTESEIASLHAQIAAAQATLARRQGSIGSLNRQISFSNVYVSVQATVAGPGHHGGGGFGLHKAGHDALRVLEVTAGVALIALAALLPLALLAALGWWVGATAQRRRRERALDAA